MSNTLFSYRICHPLTSSFLLICAQSAKMCRITSYTYTNCPHIHHETVTKPCSTYQSHPATSPPTTSFSSEYGAHDSSLSNITHTHSPNSPLHITFAKLPYNHPTAHSQCPNCALKLLVGVRKHYDREEKKLAEQVEKWLRSEVVGGDEEYKMWLVGKAEKDFERRKEELRMERERDVGEARKV